MELNNFFGKAKTFINLLLCKCGYILIKAPTAYRTLTAKGLKFDVIVDVGVAEGTPDLWVLAKDDASLILIDPLLTGELKRNLKIPRIGKVVFMEYALSDREEEGYLYLNGRKSSLLQSDGLYRKNVRLRRLDDLLEPYVYSKKNTDFAILKIDVEGSEYKVLQGSPKTISFFDVVIIELGFFSHYGADTHSVFSFMDQYGFQAVEVVDAPKNPDGSNGTADILFVNKLSAIFFRYYSSSEKV